MKKIVVCVIFLVGCGEDNPLDLAWQKFRNADFVGAHSAFTDLIESEGGQAYIGLGWTCLKLDSIPEADVYFQTAIASQDSILEAVVGNAFSSWALQQYQSTIISAANVLRRKPGYVFTHDRTVTYQDLYVQKAYSEYRLSRFAESLATLQQLEPGYNLATSDTTSELLTKLESLYEPYK